MRHLWHLLAAIQLAGSGAVHAEARPGDCRPLEPSAIVDPLDRDGLSGLRCTLPGVEAEVLIISDPDLSWPVLVEGSEQWSFEDDLLAGADRLGSSLFYFNPENDQVIWIGNPPQLVALSLSGADAVTLARLTRWVVIDIPGKVLTIIGNAAMPAAGSGG